MLRPFDTRAKSFFRGLKAFGVPLLLAVVSASYAQETPDEKHQESASPSSIQANPKPQENGGPADSERVFGVVRTFGITDDKNAPPLTSRGKFRIFIQNVTDPFTFVGTALQAGIEQATNEFPSYGQGMSGYGKRYGAAIADYSIGEFMSTYAFPSLSMRIPDIFARARAAQASDLATRWQVHS